MPKIKISEVHMPQGTCCYGDIRYKASYTSQVHKGTGHKGTVYGYGALLGARRTPVVERALMARWIVGGRCELFLVLASLHTCCMSWYVLSCVYITICPTEYNCKLNVLNASLYKMSFLLGLLLIYKTTKFCII